MPLILPPGRVEQRIEHMLDAFHMRLPSVARDVRDGRIPVCRRSVLYTSLDSVLKDRRFVRPSSMPWPPRNRTRFRVQTLTPKVGGPVHLLQASSQMSNLWPGQFLRRFATAIALSRHYVWRRPVQLQSARDNVILRQLYKPEAFA